VKRVLGYFSQIFGGETALNTISRSSDFILAGGHRHDRTPRPSTNY
jgi:hypothetical protein